MSGASDTQSTPVEQRLRESEYRYRNLFQAMAAAFWELDFTSVGGMLRQMRKAGVSDYRAHLAANPDVVREMMRHTQVLDVNDQSVALFGRGDKDAMIGASVEPFWPEESNWVFEAAVLAAVSGRPSYATECKLRTLDGRLFDGLFTACFPPDSVADGKLLIGVIDISERVAAQDMLQRVQAEFAHAARVSILGELTASIAHEINQPLAAIATNASAGLRWLDRAEPDLEEVKALAGRIIADASRAADIVGRVRAMATHRTPEPGILAVNAAIEEALLFLRHELTARGVTVELDLDPALPPVRGDRTQLQQVVVNLAMNAMQAMAGSPVRRLVLRSIAEAEEVVVRVEDSGPGLPAEHAPKLFDSFFTTKPDGMGMGLPICRSILNAHGGSITAQPPSAGGAVFIVTLPAERPHTRV